jgi:hypothetical protein
MPAYFPASSILPSCNLDTQPLAFLNALSKKKSPEEKGQGYRVKKEMQNSLAQRSVVERKLIPESSSGRA